MRRPALAVFVFGLVTSVGSACKSIKGDSSSGSSRLATVAIGKFETSGEQKAWTRGRIDFFSLETKKNVFQTEFNSKNATVQRRFQIPYGTYHVRLEYFGADGRNALYKACPDDKGAELVHKIEREKVDLALDICDMAQIAEIQANSSSSSVSNKSSSPNASTGTKPPVLGSFEDRMQKAQTSLTQLAGVVTAVPRFMTTVKRIQETDLPMLAKDRLDLSLNYVCKELERFQTDLNASLESELSSMKKTEANQILDAMRKPNHLCEPSYGVEP